MNFSESPGNTQDNPLNLSHDLLKVLLEFKDYAIFLMDAAGHITVCSAGAEALYGYSLGDLTGKHFSMFYTTEEIQNGVPWYNLKQAIEKGRFEHEEVKYRKDGSPFYGNTVLTVLYNSDGSIKAFAKVTRDVSRQKKLEEENRILTGQLEEKVAQRTKELATVVSELEAFSYSVSHDLRAPLRAISGYSIMLQEDYESKLDAEGNRIINVIVDNTKMMSQLIDDLLTFSKMARLEVVSSRIDMKGLAEKCIAELLQIENSPAPQITVHAIPECKGDANMLKQVWFNLIANALKYSSKKPDPIIDIGAAEDEKTTVYYVKDNGSGFDMKYSDKLFGVFQRLHRQDEFEGTGLGLALAKRIVTKHGGEIWAEASLNEGATFYFSIPKK